MEDAEMPRYRCHKTVHALQIREIMSPTEDGGAMIIPKEPGYAPFKVDAAYMDKHKPTPGGYFVVYADGYRSFSPKEAFEDGYTRV
jgi:hypothetical protein